MKEAMAARDQARVDRERTPCDVTEREFRERRNAVKVVLNRACSSFFQTSFRHSRCVFSSGTEVKAPPHKCPKA